MDNKGTEDVTLKQICQEMKLDPRLCPHPKRRCPQMPLTDTKCKNAKPSERPKKLFDSHGLYLEVMPNGSKYWRHKYRYLGKEKRLSERLYQVYRFPKCPMPLKAKDIFSCIFQNMGISRS